MNCVFSYIKTSRYVVSSNVTRCSVSHGSFRLQVQCCLQSTRPVAAARLPYRVKVSAGKRYAWCACGHSKKQVSMCSVLEISLQRHLG